MIVATYTRDLYEELRRIEDRIGRLFEEMPGSAEARPEGSTQMPFVDVMDRGDELVVTADMPGVDKNDIRINVSGNTLDISAERRTGQEQEEKGYIRRERSYSRYFRSVRLPVAVDKGGAKARFNNGVLEVVLPKAEKAEESNIPVS